MVRQPRRHRQRTGPPLLGCAITIGLLGMRQRLTSTDVWQTEVVIPVIQSELLLQAVFAFAQGRDASEEMLRERLPLLRCFDQPLQHGIGVHLKPPRRAADAQAFREAREHAYDELNGGAFAMEERKVGLHGGYALQEHRAQAVVLLGRRGGYCPSDDGEGEERQGGILLDEPVHRCLERAARAGRRRVSRMGRRGQIRGDPVCQGAPASRTGSPCLGPCARKGRCFNMVIVGGVFHRRHYHSLSQHAFHQAWRLPPTDMPVRSDWWRRGGAVQSVFAHHEKVSFSVSKKKNNYFYG